MKLRHAFEVRDPGSSASTNQRSQSWDVSEESSVMNPSFRAFPVILITSCPEGVIYLWMLYSCYSFPKELKDLDGLLIAWHHYLSTGKWPSINVGCLMFGIITIRCQWIYGERKWCIYYIASNSSYFFFKKTLSLLEEGYSFSSFRGYIAVDSSQSHIFSFYTQRGRGLTAELMLLLEEGFLIYEVIPSVILTLPGDICHLWQLFGFEETLEKDR